MKKKALTAAVSVLFVTVLLIAPQATADVYVPPGPPWDMSEWISPTLFVIDMQDMMPIGWIYSDGPMYDSEGFLTGVPQSPVPKIEKSNPWCPFGIDRTVIPFSTPVIIFGWIPGVSVSPDQTPPPVVLVITWNGVPYTVTLNAPGPVGYEYPPVIYDDVEDVYPFSYPYDPEAPFKTVYYNVWVGPGNYLVEQLTGSPPPPGEEFPYGYYFWYVFHPNVGDWIAFNCEGETKHPPTYDITALFEYSTVQIWFWHVCFDVRLLEIHKDIAPNAIERPTVGSTKVSESLLIKNVGKVPATQLDIWQTFPVCEKMSIVPEWETATVTIRGYREIGPIKMPDDFGLYWPYMMPSDYGPAHYDLSTLYPGETMSIWMEVTVNTGPDWDGVFVFDAMVSAWEIPPWKMPRAMEALIVGSPDPAEGQFLWIGLHLEEIEPGLCWFGTVKKWFVPGPICRNPLPPQSEYKFEMTLDPIPVDLTGDGVIDELDVEQVELAIVGLLPYDIDMDVNVNGKVDAYDLACYELAAAE